MEAELRRALESHQVRFAEDAADVPRAAVAMIFAPRGLHEGDPTERRVPSVSEGTDVFFIRRAEVDGDPWSGHMAFPGGRWTVGDEDLIATALRETWEETGLEIPRTSVIGRLDDYRPSSPGLPPLVIASFVVWLPEKAPIDPNHEIAGHVWVPLEVLTDPVHRSSLTMHRDDRSRIFETIEFEGHTIWGLTFRIVSQFVGVLSGVGLLDRENG